MGNVGLTHILASGHVFGEEKSPDRNICPNIEIDLHVRTGAIATRQNSAKARESNTNDPNARSPSPSPVDVHVASSPSPESKERGYTHVRSSAPPLLTQVPTREICVPHVLQE